MNNRSKFKLEALEPRLLLNGAGVVDLDVVDPSSDSVQSIAAIEIQTDTSSVHQELKYEAENILDGVEEISLEKGLREVAAEDQKTDDFAESTVENLSENPDAQEETSGATQLQSETTKTSEKKGEIQSAQTTRYNASSDDLDTPNFQENNSAVDTVGELVETLNTANGPPADEAISSNFLANQQITGLDTQAGGEFYPCDFVRLTPEQTVNGSIVIGSESLLSGSGTVRGHLQNNGVVSPGNSPGIQNVGSFTQIAGGTLQIEIAGTGGAGAADGHDQINVTGEARLGGTLDLALINAFTPSQGDIFQILTYGSVVGQFDQITGFEVGGGLYFVPIQGATAFYLVVTSVPAGQAYFSSNSQTEANNLRDFFAVVNPSSTASFDGIIKISDQSFGGDFALTQTTVGGSDAVTVGASNVTGLLGSGSNTTNQTGISFTGGSGAMVLLANSVASEIGGLAVMVGFELFGLSGNAYGRINTTGAIVNQTVATPSDGDAVVDFSDGSVIERVDIEGTFNLFNFIYLHGTFSFGLGVQTVNVATGIPANLGAALGSIGLDTLADLLTPHVQGIGENFSMIEGLDVLYLTAGGSNIDAFVGFGIPDFTKSFDDQDVFGFLLDNLDFGIGFYIPLVNLVYGLEEIPNFVSLKATADAFGFKGVSENVLEVSGQGISINLNNGDEWPGELGPPVIDFANSFPAEGVGVDSDGDGKSNEPAGFEVATGSDPIYLDYDGNQRIGVSIAAARINLFTFIYLEGSFAFEMGPTYRVNVATGIPANLGAALGTIGLDSLASAIGSVADIEIGENFSSINNLEVDSFTIGASNVNAFVGFGIPDFDQSFDDQDVFGFLLQNFDLGMGMFSPTLKALPGTDDFPEFISLKASADSFGFKGVSENVLTVNGQGITLNLNNGDEWPGGYGPPVIDFANSPSFAAEDLDGDGVLDDGEDRDGDGKLDPVGFEVPTGGDPVYLDYDGNQRIGVSIAAAKINLFTFIYLEGSFAFEKGPTYMVNVATGIPANLGAALGTIGLDSLASAIGSVADIEIGENFSSINNLEVDSFTIGASNVNAFVGFGIPDFDQSFDDQDVFGFLLQNFDLGMGMFSPTLKALPGTDDFPEFISLKASADSFGFKGVSENVLTVNGQGITLNLNNGDEWPGGYGPPVIDFANSPSFAAEDLDGDGVLDDGEDRDGDGKLDPVGFEVPTGGDPVYLDYDGNQRIGVSIAAAKINLFTFIYLEGSFAFEKGPTYMVNVATGIPANLGAALGTIGLDSLASAIGSVADIEIGENFSSINNLEVDSFTIGASNVNAFVGFGIPDFDQSFDDQDVFGFLLQNFDLGMGMFSPTLKALPGTDDFPEFISLKASADSFGFKGVSENVLTVNGQGITLNLNNGDEWPGGFGPPVIDFANSPSFAAEDLDGDGVLDDGEDRDGDGKLDPVGFEVPTGGDPVYLDYDGNQRIGVSIAAAKINLFTFIYLEGSFAFEKGPTYMVNVATGIPANLGAALGTIGLDSLASAIGSVADIEIGENFSSINNLEVDSFTIGASNVNAFVGFGIPDFDQSFDDQDVFGFLLQNFDLGMGMFSPTLKALPGTDDFPEFISLKASADSFGFKGVSENVLTVNGQGITLNLNNGDEWPGGFGPPVIDFANSPSFAAEDLDGDGVLDDGEDRDGDGKLDPVGFEVPTGGDPVYLDYDGNQRIGVSIAAAKINLFTFIYLEGSFAFEKGPTYMVNVATGIPANLGAALGTIGLDSLASAIGSVADIEIGENFSSINNLEVDSFTIGASNVNAFVGFGIPDFDQSFDDQDVFGFLLQNFDLGMGMFSPTLKALPGTDDFPEFISLKASADSFGFKGVSENVLTVNGQGITLNLNNGDEWPGGFGPPVIDFANSPSFAAEDLDGDGVLDDGEDRDGDGKLDPVGFEVPTGGDPVYLDYDGNQRIGVSIAAAKINLFTFIYLEGSFAFEKGPTYMVNVATGIPANLGAALGTIGLDSLASAIGSVADIEIGENFSSINNLEVDSFTIGASNVNAFVGFGIPDFDQSFDDQDVFGFLLQNFDLGMGMFSPTLKALPGTDDFPEFISLKASADYSALRVFQKMFLR